MTLRSEEFLRRFFLHVLPHGFVRIRFFGFLANRSRAKMLPLPSVRFLSLLQTALASGRDHVANRRGRVPDYPEHWGWQRKPTGTAWAPQGTRIGWLATTELFLEPAASYELAQQIAGAEGLPVGAQTLRHRLREHGLLASLDTGRQMLLVRRTLEGAQRQVLHLKASNLLNCSKL